MSSIALRRVAFIKNHSLLPFKPSSSNDDTIENVATLKRIGDKIIIEQKQIKLPSPLVFPKTSDYVDATLRELFFKTRFK